MASARERRANAGSRMAQLLENEDNDEFYSSAYGGFAEVKSNSSSLSKLFFYCLLI